MAVQTPTTHMCEYTSSLELSLRPSRLIIRAAMEAKEAAEKMKKEEKNRKEKKSKKSTKRRRSAEDEVTAAAAGSQDAPASV